MATAVAAMVVEMAVAVAAMAGEAQAAVVKRDLREGAIGPAS